MMRTAVGILLACALLSTAACSSPAADDHPAVTVVQALLELRRADVRDPAAYAPHLLESSVATALAEGSSDPTGTPRVPEWEPPYVSAETSTTADVVVVWRPGVDFPGWSPVTLFFVVLDEGRWAVADALETTTAPAPLGDVSAGQPAQE
ncbi:MAG: hypothetical protein Q7W44_09435 [Coriobacteriia bacterium]|nr:hypothetical protein [Coriobacteriia bacterium]